MRHTKTNRLGDAKIIENKRTTSHDTRERDTHDIEYYVRRLFLNEDKLPYHLFQYHAPKHTLDLERGVVAVADGLAYLEGLNNKERELLRIAAYFHDTGFMASYVKNEPYGAQFAESYMQAKGYSREDIDIVNHAILITDITKEPTTKLEMILRDADLHNVGTAYYFQESLNVYEELRARNMGGNATSSVMEWFSDNVKFISQHRFYTKSAEKVYGSQKQKNIKDLKSIVGEDVVVDGLPAWKRLGPEKIV